VKTLSDLQIDVDKDWKAHGIYNLGDLTPKVDGAYNLGSPTARFDTAYAANVPAAETLIHRTVSEAADNIYGADTDLIPAGFFDAWPASLSADIAYQTELQPVKAASIFDHSNLGVDRAASIFDDANLLPVKAGDILDHSNLSGSAKTGRRSDIMTHSNLSLSKFDDIIAESVYGITGGDAVGVKKFVYQTGEEKDFHSVTETPDHAYWHRIYSTPAAFETIYQDYTTELDEHGTTPSKSAPGTADPNPQPGAMWSVSMVPDGTQVGGFASLGPDPAGPAWDGEYLWNPDASAAYIYQIRTDGTQVGDLPRPVLVRVI